MRRVLIVAYYFPPIGGIGSIRLARFAELLPRYGWEPTVLAPRHTPHQSDPGLHYPEDRIVRSRSLELSQLGRIVPGARSAGVPPLDERRYRLREMLRSAALRYLAFPDAQIGWFPGAMVAGLRTLARERFDAIYSSANPVTAHLVARALASRGRLPWVAEYRDPWRDRFPPDHPYVGRAEALERAVAREATVVAMPTPTWAAHYGRLWGTDIAVLPNGHDGPLRERRSPEHPTLTYVGSYYPGEHDLATVWRALARLREQGHRDLPRVRFVGHLPPELRNEIAAYGLSDLLESTGFVPHDEAMREVMSSSMLIASGVAGEHPAQRGWVPAKLFDYLASGLPVLFLADPDTDAARLLVGHAGVHVVRPGEVDATADALQAGLKVADYDREVGDLSRDARTRELAEILDRARRMGRRAS
jgi:glycosyltransferase involved in cell wall biosynthesis